MNFSDRKRFWAHKRICKNINSNITSLDHETYCGPNVEESFSSNGRQMHIRNLMQTAIKEEKEEQSIVFDKKGVSAETLFDTDWLDVKEET